MTGPCAGVGGLNVGCAGGMSLKIDVKLDAAALGGVGDDAAGDDAWPNRAVNSPTFFFGGSIDCDE